MTGRDDWPIEVCSGLGGRELDQKGLHSILIAESDDVDTIKRSSHKRPPIQLHYQAECEYVAQADSSEA